MRRLFFYDPYQRRVYVYERHLHHGFDGLILMAVGIALVIHDLHDWPFFPERFVKDQLSAG